MKDLRVVFMGTPEFSVPVLKELIEATNVVMVVTQPDKPVGRKRELTPSPVKVVAEENGIKVFTPEKLRKESQVVLDADPDIIITCAYGQIVPKEILDYPGLGCINVHASLLPKYRGASPINAAIRDGEEETGVTIMYMDETLDTGDMIFSASIPIEDDDNYGTVSEKLSVLGAKTLMKVMPKIYDETNFRIQQDHEMANYVGLIKREDTLIDFNKTKKEVHNLVRSLNPVPLAYTTIDGNDWKIIETKIGEEKTGEIGTITSVSKDSFGIMCADGEILVTKIKPFGKKEMLVKDFFNGYKKEDLLNKKVGV